jgi:hypothetical protein
MSDELAALRRAVASGPGASSGPMLLGPDPRIVALELELASLRDALVSTVKGAA